MKGIRRSALGLCLLGLIGCAGFASPPGWVVGERPEDYPEESWISALGTGESLAAAQAAAKGELSRVFSAELVSEIELIDRESTTTDGAKQSSDWLGRTQIRTDLELQGVEVPLHWRDSRTDQIWVLAVLERRKECARIRSEGRDLADELEFFVNDSRGASSLLIAIRSSTRAVELGTQLDLLQARSRVLGIRCLDERFDSTGLLRREAAELRQRVHFVVRARDVDAEQGFERGALPGLRDTIAANLSRLGFRVGADAEAGGVAVDAELRLSRVERGTDWVEYRFAGAAEIAGPGQGEAAVVVVEVRGAESHPEASSARLRALRAGERALAHELDRKLRAFLEAGGGL
jgi:hypothetical protein